MLSSVNVAAIDVTLAIVRLTIVIHMGVMVLHRSFRARHQLQLRQNTKQEYAVTNQFVYSSCVRIPMGRTTRMSLDTAERRKYTEQDLPAQKA